MTKSEEFTHPCVDVLLIYWSRERMTNDHHRGMSEVRGARRSLIAWMMGIGYHAHGQNHSFIDSYIQSISQNSANFETTSQGRAMEEFQFRRFMYNRQSTTTVPLHFIHDTCASRSRSSGGGYQSAPGRIAEFRLRQPTP